MFKYSPLERDRSCLVPHFVGLYDTGLNNFTVFSYWNKVIKVATSSHWRQLHAILARALGSSWLRRHSLSSLRTNHYTRTQDKRIVWYILQEFSLFIKGVGIVGCNRSSSEYKYLVHSRHCCQLESLFYSWINWECYPFSLSACLNALNWVELFPVSKPSPKTECSLWIEEKSSWKLASSVQRRELKPFIEAYQVLLTYSKVDSTITLSANCDQLRE